MVSYKALNTTRKSVMSNTCHRVWNVDAHERAATRKSTNAHFSDAVWNIDASKRITT